MEKTTKTKAQVKKKRKKKKKKTVLEQAVTRQYCYCNSGPGLEEVEQSLMNVIRTKERTLFLENSPYVVIILLVSLNSRMPFGDDTSN